MKSERIGREPERIGNSSRRHPFGPALHKQSEHSESMFLGEGGERDGGLCLSIFLRI